MTLTLFFIIGCIPFLIFLIGIIRGEVDEFLYFGLIASIASLIFWFVFYGFLLPHKTKSYELTDIIVLKGKKSVIVESVEGNYTFDKVEIYLLADSIKGLLVTKQYNIYGIELPPENKKVVPIFKNEQF